MKELELINLALEVDKFIKDPDSVNCIRYYRDGGHTYSYLDHFISIKCEDNDELTDKLDTWMYENDDCPPCEIYVKRDTKGKIIKVQSGCGCHDHLDPNDPDDLEEITNTIRVLNEEFEKSECEKNWLVTNE